MLIRIALWRSAIHQWQKGHRTSHLLHRRSACLLVSCEPQELHVSSCTEAMYSLQQACPVEGHIQPCPSAPLVDGELASGEGCDEAAGHHPLRLPSDKVDPRGTCNSTLRFLQSPLGSKRSKGFFSMVQRPLEVKSCNTL